MKALTRGKFFGTVTVGERGQVVIPAEVRKAYKIKSGDKLVAFAKPDMFGFVPAEEFNRFLEDASKLMQRIKNKSLKAG